jgi:hypothetical protein
MDNWRNATTRSANYFTGQVNRRNATTRLATDSEETFVRGAGADSAAICERSIITCSMLPEGCQILDGRKCRPKKLRSSVR